jgi:hypothetical protein
VIREGLQTVAAQKEDTQGIRERIEAYDKWIQFVCGMNMLSRINHDSLNDRRRRRIHGGAIVKRQGTGVMGLLWFDVFRSRTFRTLTYCERHSLSFTQIIKPDPDAA